MLGDLTAREVEVCIQIVRGIPHREIGINLGIHVSAVHKHLRNISYKLGLNYEKKQKLILTVFIAKNLMEAAQQYPLVAAALEL